MYGRQVRGHAIEGPWADALSDLVGRSLTLVEREDDAWATDSRPATLISRSSVDLIDGDGRRFRMLLELDGLEALGEEAWRGRRVQRGRGDVARRRRRRRGAPFPPRARTPAGATATCSASFGASAGPVDGEPCLGVYAEVLEPGMVRVGDEVEVL